MSEFEDFLPAGEEFTGQARLFPLPNLVMFPHVIQPLHVFEPRYRDLTRDALVTDKLIAMAVLAPGWQDDYDGSPAVHPVACLARIATHEELDDGRFNLLVLGVKRIRLLEEFPSGQLYRMANVELLDDEYPTAGDAQRDSLQQQLRAAFRQKVHEIAHSSEQLDKLLGMEVSLGLLTDLVAYTLDFNVAFKADLLAETNVDVRAQRLLAQIEADQQSDRATARMKFPPDFSNN